MKTFLKFFGGLLALIIIGVSIFLWTFDINTYRGYITEKISASLGHPVSIDRLEMKLSLIPTIKASSIRIDNPDTIQDAKPLFLSNSAEITIALAPLLSHRLEVQKIAFGSSFINLIQRNGQNNWSVPSNENTKQVRVSDESSSPWLTEMRFDNIAFEKTTLLLTTDTGRYNAEITDASVKQLKLFSFTLAYDKQTFKVSGNGNDILLFLSGEPNYLFNLELTHPSLTAKFNGSIGDTKKFQNMVFNFSLTGDNLRETLKRFKFNLPKLPSATFEVQAAVQGNLNSMDITRFNIALGGNKLNLNSTGTLETLTQTPQMTLSGNLTLSDAQLAQSWGLRPQSARFELIATPTQIALTNLIIQANRSDIQLTSEITNWKERPQLTIAVASEYLNTADFLFQSPTPYIPVPVATSNPTARKIPEIKWDLAFLKGFDATVRFNLPHVKFTDNLTGYVGLEGNLTLKNGQLKTDALKGTLLDGTLSGNATVDVSQSAPNYEVQLSAKNLKLNNVKKLNSVLQDAVLDASCTLTTSGHSLRETLARLNGEGVLELSNGTIVSEWFNALPIVELMARQKANPMTFSNSDKISQILCGAAKIDIQNGTLISQNSIALETSSVNFQLGGSLNLADESINLSIRPILNTTNEKINALLSAGQLVSITGTLSQPKPVLNASNVVGQINSVLNPTAQEPYALCESILNHPTVAQKNAASQRTTVLSFPKTETPAPVKSTTPEEQLRQQLLNTLQDALKQ